MSASLLMIESVWVSDHKTRVPLLRDVSLDIVPGEVVAVTGPDARARAALLHIAATLMPPDSGEVRITVTQRGEGRRVRSPLRRICWIDREPDSDELQVCRAITHRVLVHSYNVREAEKLTWAALDRAGVASCGLRNWGELTAWERVCAGLACGFATRSPLVIISDLFDGLGWRQAEEARRLLRSLVEELDCGVLLSVSDVEYARRIADRVLCLEHGCLTTAGHGLVIHANMDVASELWERGHKDAAAVITASSLEEHLRKLALCWDVPIGQAKSSKRANGLNNALVAVGAYNQLQHKEVTAWLELRNKAVHGQYEEYTSSQVWDFIRGVRRFITSFPASLGLAHQSTVTS